jgi:lysozyme
MDTAKIKRIASPLIEKSEGRELKAYVCAGGKLTIGVGSTRNVTEGMVITNAEADSRLHDDIMIAIDAIKRNVKVPLTDNQAAALCSFIFNLGEGNFKKSTLLKKLNEGDYDAVPIELARWNKAGGKVLRGLVARRAAEAALWSSDGMELEETATRGIKRDVPTVINTENVNAAAAVAGGMGAMNLSGDNPISWALAIIALVSAGVFFYLFFKRRGA